MYLVLLIVYMWFSFRCHLVRLMFTYYSFEHVIYISFFFPSQLVVTIFLSFFLFLLIHTTYIHTSVYLDLNLD